MIRPNDPPVEMRRLWLDADTADRLLAGRIHPDDASPGYSEAARVLRAAPRQSTTKSSRMRPSTWRSRQP